MLAQHFPCSGLTMQWRTDLPHCARREPSTKPQQRRTAQCVLTLMGKGSYCVEHHQTGVEQQDPLLWIKSWGKASWRTFSLYFTCQSSPNHSFISGGPMLRMLHRRRTINCWGLHLQRWTKTSILRHRRKNVMMMVIVQVDLSNFHGIKLKKHMTVNRKGGKKVWEA